MPLPAGIDRVLRDYEAAWRASDPEALALLFTEDGFVLADGSPPVRGRDAIRRKYAGSGGPLWLRPLGHAVDGDVGYVVGVYGRDPGEPPRGKFVLALRRDGTGRWRIAADMDNRNERRKDGP